MTIKGLEINKVDFSMFELYRQPPISKPRIRYRAVRGLVSRCPKEIWIAESLSIERAGDCHGAHGHSMVTVNGIELCPVSAIMFIVAARNYRWSEGLQAAINKIMEEAHES